MIEILTNPNYYQTTQASKTTSSTKAGANFAGALQAFNVGQSPKTMDDMFSQASQAHQVPENLLKAVGYHESRFKPEVVSRCGAMGIMQLMPTTAKAMGVSDAFDPEQNIMGGAKLLGQLLNKYDGDLKLTLAAYGAGSGAVAKYNGVPPYKETQDFVNDIMSVVGQETTYSTPQITPENPTPAYTKAADEMQTYTTYTTEDYRLFLEMLLDSARENSRSGISEDYLPLMF